ACESPPPRGDAPTARPSSSVSVNASPVTARSNDSALPPMPTQSAEAPAREIVGASQIMVSYKGAEATPKTVTRTKDEAKKRAEEALKKPALGTPFEELVKQYSADATSRAANGAMGNFERGAMPKPIADAAFALKVDEISRVVEAPRGYFILKRTK